jgi:glutamate synthase (NADPH/NADH) large chain
MTGGTVVVLGPTGRNFAAGMSGGTAFVWKLNPALVNTELVSVGALEGDSVPVVRGLVAKHFEETGSAVASRLLDRWEDAVGEFSAVIPRDYARVLSIIRQAEENGQDPDTAVMEALRA